MPPDGMLPPGWVLDDEPVTSAAPAPPAAGLPSGWTLDEAPVSPEPVSQEPVSPEPVSQAAGLPPGWALDPVPAPVPVPGPTMAGAFTGLPGVPEPDAGPGALPPPDPNDTRPGFHSSLVSGLVDAMREGRQLTSGDAFTDPADPAAPVDRTFMGKVGYGLAHGTPTLASMLLGAGGGAAAGTAVGGPVGTAVGGALGGAAGGGLMDFAQNLIPSYQDARRRGLEHDAAVSQAYESAAASGLLTGVTAPLFALKPFKSVVSNLLLATGVTGPSVGAVHRGIVNPAITGQPAPSASEMIEGAASDALGGGLTAGAMHAGPAIARRLMPDTRPTLDLGPTPPPPAAPPQIPGAPGPAPERPAILDVLRPEPGTPPAPVVEPLTPGTPPNGSPAAPITPAPVVPTGDVSPVIPEPPGPAPAPVPTGATAPDPVGIVPVAPGAQPVVPGGPPAPPAPTGDTPGGIAGTPTPAPTPAPTPVPVEPVVNAPGTSPEPPVTPVPPPVSQGETPAPPPVPPAESQHPLETTATATGRKIDYRWEVQDANALTPASGDLQPRDRTDRVQAEAQRNKIYAEFDPERLHRSPEADRGAPIIGPLSEDPANTIEAGNNRVEVLKRIFAGTTPEDQAKAQAYRDMIHRVTGQDTSGMSQPVLVRRRATPLTPEERRAFAQEANTPATQAMSATEQAQVDAANLSHDHLGTLDGTKDLTTPANRDFVNRWVKSLPQTEHNRVTDADGYLSAEGVRRLNAAILARAYGDKGTLARGLESTNDETKSLSGALADAAPAMAKLRSGVEKGEYPKHYDIAANIADAADRVRVAREKGIKRDDILNQQDAFNPLDPVTEQLVRAFYEPTGQRAASRVSMADTLRHYARAAADEAAPKGLLPGDKGLDPAEILKALNDARVKKAPPEAGQGGLFGPKKPETPPAPAAPTGKVLVGDLKPGDIVISPEGVQTVTRVTATRKDGQVTVYTEGQRRPWIVRADRAWTVLPPAPAAPARKLEPAKLTPAPVPEIAETRATHLQAGDVIRTPKGENLTVTAVAKNQNGEIAVTVEGRKKPLVYAPYKTVQIHATENEPLGDGDTLASRDTDTLSEREVSDALALRRGGGRGRTAPAPGGVTPMPGRIKPKPVPPAVPAPEPGAPETQAQVDFTPGTPRYRQGFVDALRGTSEDPRTAMNKPLDQQVSLLSRALRNKYGFRNVIVDPEANLKTTRDQLLNMHHNMQGLAHALDWSEDTLSLAGRLNLVLVPRNREWHGMYSPGTKNIHIADGSNSFAHEHWHAIDQYMSDLLNNSPNRATLFSHAARLDQLDPAQPVHRAFADVLNALFYDQGELALRRLTLEQTAERVDAAGQPTKQALEAQAQIRALDAGSSKLRIPHSEFRVAAARMRNPAYWSSAHELFARAGEAYTAWKMGLAGQRTEGVVRSDAAYQNAMLAHMRQAYPNAADRVRIFDAFDKLRVELNRASVLPLRGPGALPPPEGATLPAAHERTLVPGPGFIARLKADVRALRLSNLRGGDHAPAIFGRDPIPPPLDYSTRKAAKTGVALPKTGGAQWADVLAGHWNSTLGNMERWIEQSPKAARPALEKIRNALGRSTERGTFVAESFEARARRRSSGQIARLEDILRDAGLVNKVGRLHLTKAQEQDLWHTMATNERTYPLNPHDLSGTGPRRPIESRVLDAAQMIRQDIFEAEWDHMHAQGLDIGHTREAYVPRVMDDDRIRSDGHGFISDMTQVNRVIQRNDFAAANEPEAMRLRRWWRGVPRAVRDSTAFTDPQRDAMKRLGAIGRRIGDIDRELAGAGTINPTAHNPQALIQERAKLVDEAQDIHDTHADGILGTIAHIEATEMNRRVNVGHSNDFVTVGPKSEFLRGRTLPPEADQLLRKWYINDPLVAIPMYLHAAARKTAYHEVFGPDGRNITAWLNEAERGGAHGNVLDDFKTAVETITGRSTRDNDKTSTKIANTVSALGTFITMQGATLSALAEPTATMLNGGGMRMMFRTYGNLFGHFYGTADAAERMRIARLVGGITSHLQGAANANRTTDYAGTPRLGGMVNNFYELAMSPAIRGLRAAALGAGNEQLRDMLEVAQELTTQNAPLTRAEENKLDDTRRLLADWGVQASQIPMMHDWMRQFPDAQPTAAAIETTREGDLYKFVSTRILDQFNANPTAAEKPMGAMRTSYGNMMLGLTSFPWTFFRNTVLPAMARVGHARQRQWERSERENASKWSARYEAEKARFSYGTAALMSAAVLVAGTGLMATIRSYLFNHDTWKKHQEAGDLGQWLFDTAVSQSGLNGPFDMITQAMTSLRYTSDLSNLTEGPFLATELRYAMDFVRMVDDIFTPDSKTNTRIYNGLHAVTQLAVKPAALAGLTAIMQRVPQGGPLAAIITGLSIGGTSSTVTRGAVNAIAGPRGTELKDPNKEEPDDDEMDDDKADAAKAAAEKKGGGGGMAQSAVGLVDDILAPLIKATPAPLRVAGVATAGAVTGALAYRRARQFGRDGTPPKVAH